MRTVKTIETDRYEPADDGIHLKFIGKTNAGETFQALYKHLEETDLLPDEYFSLSYDINEKEELPDFHTAACHVNWGGSEGIYLDIDLEYRKDHKREFMHFVTGKTLSESGDAFLKMYRIAAECSMILNGRGEIVKISDPFYDMYDEEPQDLKEVNRVCLVRSRFVTNELWVNDFWVDAKVTPTKELFEQAAKDFLETPKGKERLKETENGFNWGNAIEEIPESIWNAHGIYPLKNGVSAKSQGLKPVSDETHTAIKVNHDDFLIELLEDSFIVLLELRNDKDGVYERFALTLDEFHDMLQNLSHDMPEPEVYTNSDMIGSDYHLDYFKADAGGFIWDKFFHDFGWTSFRYGSEPDKPVYISFDRMQSLKEPLMNELKENRMNPEPLELDCMIQDAATSRLPIDNKASQSRKEEITL